MTPTLCNTEIRGSTVVCVVCGFAMPRRIVGDRFTKNCKPHKPRTAEELAAVQAVCRACPHYLAEPTETLDAGVCLIRAANCLPCASLEQFAKYIADGNPCADTPPRFPATEFEELTA
jgi:hypothetical protein